jgi:hypothetical protein
MAILYYYGRAHPEAGELPGCSPPNPQNLNLKKHKIFVDNISNVLRDLPFRRKQPLKSDDD